MTVRRECGVEREECGLYLCVHLPALHSTVTLNSFQGLTRYRCLQLVKNVVLLKYSFYKIPKVKEKIPCKNLTSSVVEGGVRN